MKKLERSAKLALFPARPAPNFLSGLFSKTLIDKLRVGFAAFIKGP
ncbi:MAG: hypothetical protein ACRDRI_04040 [Pseudonocardiaceae bacterium]